MNRPMTYLRRKRRLKTRIKRPMTYLRRKRRPKTRMKRPMMMAMTTTIINDKPARSTQTINAQVDVTCAAPRMCSRQHN